MQSNVIVEKINEDWHNHGRLRKIFLFFNVIALRIYQALKKMSYSTIVLKLFRAHSKSRNDIKKLTHISLLSTFHSRIYKIKKNLARKASKTFNLQVIVKRKTEWKRKLWRLRFDENFNDLMKKRRVLLDLILEISQTASYFWIKTFVKKNIFIYAGHDIMAVYIITSTL